MKDATFKLRVPTAELERWRRLAGKRGIAAWIRERCNDNGAIHPSKNVGRDAASEPRKAKPGTCAHRKQRGDLCYKCDPKFGLPTIIALLLMLLAMPCYALPDNPVPKSVHRFDSGWLARAHWTAAAFDYATTGNANSECLARWGVNSTCRETVEPWFLGRRPQAWRLGLVWAGESAAVSFIPNRKIRRVAQVCLIGSHVFFGARNLYRWH